MKFLIDGEVFTADWSYTEEVSVSGKRVPVTHCEIMKNEKVVAESSVRLNICKGEKKQPNRDKARRYSLGKALESSEYFASKPVYEDVSNEERDAIKKWNDGQKEMRSTVWDAYNNRNVKAPTPALEEGFHADELEIMP